MDWRESLSVGDPHVDAMHKKIIESINAVARSAKSLNDNASVLEYTKAMNFLREYSLIHFRAEELMMKKIGYPHIKVQQELHDSMSYELMQIEGRRSSCMFLMDLLKFLSNYLTEHMLSVDNSEYRAYVARYRSRHPNEAMHDKSWS